MLHKQLLMSVAGRMIHIAFSLTLWLVALTGFGQPQQVNEARELAPNQTLEGEIAGTETHRYKISLQKDEFFQVRVEQKGVDVALKLMGAGGNVLATMDSPNGKDGFETLTFVASQSSNYRLEVSGFDAKAEKGKYIIRREASRVATASDRRRVEVERTFAEAITTLRAEGQRQAAMAKLEKALSGWQELSDAYMTELSIQRIKRAKSARAKTLYEAAKQLANQRTEEAMKASLLMFDEARQITKTVNEKNGEIICLNALAEVNNALGNKTKALEYYKQALALLKDRQEPEEEAKVLDSLGRICVELQQYQDALEYFNRNLSVYVTLQDSLGEATVLGNLGMTYIHLGEKQKAIEILTRSLTLYRTLENKAGEARVLTGLGRAYSDMDKDEKAKEFYTQALPLSRSSGDKTDEANLLHGLGVIYSDKEEKQKALEFYLQSIPVYQSLGDMADLSVAFYKIGFIYLGLGDKLKAVEYLLKSLAIDRELQNKEDQALTLSHLSALFIDLGEKEKAIEHNKQALAICRELKDKKGEATFLSNIGMIYLGLGESQIAREEYFDEAIVLFKDLQHKEGLAWVHFVLGASYIDSHNYQKQLEHFEQALALNRDLQDKRKEAQTLNSMASVYDSLGRKQKAIELYKQALMIDADDGAVLHNISNTYTDLGDHQRAFEYLVQSLVSSLSGGKDGEAIALYGISNTLRSLGHIRLSIFYGKQAVNRFQELREVIRGLDYETQKSFLRRIDFVYRVLAESLIEEGRIAEAVHILNLYQDQQFFDFNREPKEPAKPLSLSPYEAALASRYEPASRKVSQIGLQIWDLKRRARYAQPGPEVVARRGQLEAEFKVAADALVTVLKDTKTDSSKIVAEQNQVPVTKDVIELQKALDQTREAPRQGTVALYTLVGIKQFHLLLVTPEDIKSFSSPIEVKDFNDKILQFHTMLKSTEYDPRPLGKRLYDTILKPVEVTLKKIGAQTLVWSLDGNLRYVPMAALSPNGKSYLVEQYQNVVFTRADRERMTRAVSARWTGTGFGSSQAQRIKLFGKEILFCELPGVTAELQAIFGTNQKAKGILTGEVVTDTQFTQTKFYESLVPRRHLVHISSHFLFHPGDDSRSFLVLGNGTPLTLKEIKKHGQLFDGVELLTLSACNTAAHQANADGREIDGFAELAQRLGASAVLATLWSVSDKTTPRLMSDFYRLRQEGEGTTKTDALRRAQLALLNGKAHVEGGDEQRPCTVKDLSEPTAKIVIVPTGRRNNLEANRDTGLIYVDQIDAPAYRRDAGKPYAHPYYWASFILFGNWR